MREGKDKGNALADPWTSDLESSMKYLGYGVKSEDRQPGDLIFNWRGAKPYGHVGLLLEHGQVLENIKTSYRPKSIHLGRHLSLTPLENFSHTLIARLQQRK